MEMKGYTTLPKSLELEPHHQMQFSVIPRSPPVLDEGYYHSVRDSVFYVPSTGMNHSIFVPKSLSYTIISITSYLQYQILYLML